MAYFSLEDLTTLMRGHSDARGQYSRLLERYMTTQFKNGRAREYALQGFCRRLGTLIHALDQVFAALPPDLDVIPERGKTEDATIAVQSFVINTAGCLDNLAWVWVYEKGLMDGGNPLRRVDVGLGHKKVKVRQSFSPVFRAYLYSREKWLSHVEEFRDSLAHRISLYIPPYTVSPHKTVEYDLLEQASGQALRARDYLEWDRLQVQQRSLGRFQPLMTHSIHENAPAAVFHFQLLQDFVTVDEFGRMMLDELAFLHESSPQLS